MIDIKKYISSGIIEQYCLGGASPEERMTLEQYCLQFPEVRQALKEHQLLLENYLSQFELVTPVSGKARMFQSLEDEHLNETILSADKRQFHKFISISRYSKLEKWKRLTQHLAPPENFDIHSHLLFRDSKKLLSVTWIKDFLPDEVHKEKVESFFVLEGSCDCILGEKTIKMEEGSFLEIPLHVVHNLTVTSKQPLKVILTKKKIA